MEEEHQSPVLVKMYQKYQDEADEFPEMVEDDDFSQEEDAEQVE